MRARSRKTYVEVVAHDNHGRITARTLALDLNDGELAILGRLSRLYAAQVAADGVEDVVRATEHAGSGSADLHKVLADWFTVVCNEWVGLKRCGGSGRTG